MQNFRYCPLIVGCLSLLLEVAPAGAVENQKPNVLLIMVDDLGFSDLGCYGSEIRTPHLDRLAENGVRFTQFYNTARCWPTRAALMTGYYPQQVRRDALPGIQKASRPNWAPLLPKRLRPLGYRSYHSGKWHLDGMPIQNGFDRSYYLKDQGRFFYPKVHWKDDIKLEPVDQGSGYYATTAIADHAIECLKEHQSQSPDQPFFHYLAFTAPHFPLQALPEDIKRYDEIYQIGWDQIRQQRWRKIRKSGIVSGNLSDIEYQVGPPYAFPAALEKLGEGELNRPRLWKKLSPQQRSFQAKKMAVHAAMIDRVDQEIGRVITQLKAMQAVENTVIFFLSDNGASAEIMVRTDGHDPAVPAGSGASYLCLGPGWATVANTPFRRHKTWVHEGGIRTPLIIHWPTGIQGKLKLNRSVGHVIDLVPTILELAGGEPLPRKGGPDLPGRSLVPWFESEVTRRDQEIWWSHEGNRALRKGQFKIVAAKGDSWALFDLQQDPTEQIDLAHKSPNKVAAMEQRWLDLQQSFIRLHQSEHPPDP
ncbi:MAG: arylsulfatase [Planctomycetota bacterium]|nr:arylsulfatase [Planctomycetota bacterium]